MEMIPVPSPFPRPNSAHQMCCKYLILVQVLNVLRKKAYNLAQQPPLPKKKKEKQEREYTKDIHNCKLTVHEESLFTMY